MGGRHGARRGAGVQQCRRSAAGSQGAATTIWPDDAGPLPTADDPALALVLVPAASGAPAGRRRCQGDAAPTWVFPFDRPLPPGEGDNQALAVNTEDGSVAYDVSFALVWVDDDTALNRNEAFALASCRDCTTVAVAFQVVLLVGSVDVVVPQNLSAAVNYACVECVTYALATQLVVTLPGPLSDADMAELSAIWAELQEFGEQIEGVPLAELRDRLTEFEARILDVVRPAETDPAVAPHERAEPSGAGASGDPPRRTDRSAGGGHGRPRRDGPDHRDERRRPGRRAPIRRPSAPATEPSPAARDGGGDGRGEPAGLTGAPSGVRAGTGRMADDPSSLSWRPRVRVVRSRRRAQPRPARHLLQRPPGRRHRRDRAGQPDAGPAPRHTSRAAARRSCSTSSARSGTRCARAWPRSGCRSASTSRSASWIGEKLSRAKLNGHLLSPVAAQRPRRVRVHRHGGARQAGRFRDAPGDRGRSISGSTPPLLERLIVQADKQHDWLADARREVAAQVFGGDPGAAAAAAGS